ncbi:hypothetical protein YPPY66_2226, partial [Yersinia pestis PY-66]
MLSARLLSDYSH